MNNNINEPSTFQNNASFGIYNSTHNENNIKFDEGENIKKSEAEIELSNELFLEKINVMKPESAMALYKKMIIREEKPQKTYPFFVNKPYSWAIQNQMHSLFLYVSTQLYPKEFEP
jgi:hypothetical protein